MAEAQEQKEGPSTIDYAIITSIDGSRDVDVSTGVVNLRYYESILQDGVKGSIMFADAGNSVGGKTVMEGLPLTGSEYFQLKIRDNNDVELTQRMIVTNPTPIFEE